MDELADLMSDSGAIGNCLDSSKTVNCDRSHQYKAKSSSDQRKRRDKLLNLQKKSREEVVNQLRQLGDDDWQIFSDVVLQKQSGDSMDTLEGNYKNSHRKKIDRTLYKDQLMLSEWMIDIPADFETSWVMTPSPVGRRCLAVARGGTTYMYLKSGYCNNTFPSKLPGGSYRKSGDGGQHGITMLDCVFDEMAKTFYVLDVLCWNDQPFIDSERDFRHFWVTSKLQECPGAQEFSRINPFKFYHLPSFPCKKESLEEAMAEKFHFKVDGLLFYHRQAHYLCGSTPLVVWLKPYMLPEVLGLDINDEYIEAKPTAYSGFQNHLQIVQTDSSIAQKHQDLYEFPEGENAKADRIIKHQLHKHGRKPVIIESQFKHTQSDVRDVQLGIVTSLSHDSGVDDSDRKGEAGKMATGFKFGQAPVLNPHSQVLANTRREFSGSADNSAGSTAMEADNAGNAAVSALPAQITGAHLISAEDKQASTNNTCTIPPTNQWSQFR